MPSTTAPERRLLSVTVRSGEMEQVEAHDRLTSLPLIVNQEVLSEEVEKVVHFVVFQVCNGVAGSSSREIQICSVCDSRCVRRYGPSLTFSHPSARMSRVNRAAVLSPDLSMLQKVASR